MNLSDNIKELHRIKKTKGNVKGSCGLAIFEYLREKVSEEEIKEIKKRINFYGYVLDPEKLSPVSMCPIDFELAIIFSIQDVLGWKDSEIKEMGRNIPKLSFIVKFFVKYLVSLKKGYEHSSIYWQTHFDFGKMETPELNEKENYLVLTLKEFDIHPIYCVFLTGYFETMAGFILGKKENIFCEEKECVFRGDPHHLFTIKWS